MENYPVQLSLRLDWSEMDLFGHINNVSYFKYIQASRVNYWETIGLTNLLEENKTGPILASTSCQFLKPLFYPGNIVVEARIAYIKNSSFGVSHRILNENGEVVATAEDVIVVYDFDTNQKISFPPDLKKKVEELEGRTF
jgi:acyl-CoA thioester hydrolase